MYEIKTFATDNDGVKSDDVIGYVRVNNIAPVLDALPAQQALFEDEVLNLSAFALDFADQDVLMYCWDLLSSIDSDGNGIMSDDCDVEGPDLVYSWSLSGLKSVTANVWDDDNESDSFTIDVTIVNRPPAANIFIPADGFKITEGNLSHSTVLIQATPRLTAATYSSSGTIQTRKGNPRWCWKPSP